MNLQLQTVKLELLTPAWLTGADQSRAEFRVPAIRGQLRFWLRTVFPGQSLDESIFGRANARGTSSSLVRLRVREEKGSLRTEDLERYTGRRGDEMLKDPESYFLWPLRKKSRGVIHPITDNSLASFTLEILWFPPAMHRRAALDPALQKAVRAFSLLGTVGTRATRGYGSVWTAGEDFPDAGALADALSFLPASVSVCLLPDGGRTGRDALAHAARWLRSQRVGTARFGSTPSAWGKADHDTALHPRPGSVLHRPALGMPLAQNYREGPKLQTKYRWHDPSSGLASWNDRYPSPLRFKVVRIANRYRVLLVHLRDCTLPVGTRLQVVEGRTVRGEAQLSHNLLDHLLTCGEPLH